MKVEAYRYSDFTYARCSAEDKELVTTEKESLLKSRGMLYLTGGLVCVYSDYCPIDTYTYSTTEMTYGYPVTGTFITGQANGYTEWVCIEQDLEKFNYTIEVVSFSKNYKLPSNTGFIVVSGSVNANGVAAKQDNYFKPKPQDIKLTGNATIIILK